MNSIFFKAHNNCNFKKQKEILIDTIEFYHDKGGLSTYKQEIINRIKKIFMAKLHVP